MRIAYFGYDFFAACLRSLSAAGHDILSVFTFQTDDTWNFNRQILCQAAEIGCAIHFNRPDENTIAYLVRERCDLHKIPVFDSAGMANGIRGINIHPTLLPHGRGKWPLPWLVLRHPEYAGLSIHKLSCKWDAGDILAQMRIRISDEDDLETLSMKLQIEAPSLLGALMIDFEAAWRAATPQHEGGSYWSMPAPEDRRLDWSLPVQDLLRIVRAFSKFEATAVVDGKFYIVTRANGWVAGHSNPVGTVVHESNREIVVAARDGYVCLQEFSVVKDPRRI
jgi:methionyl-tRNA formyltransferase